MISADIIIAAEHATFALPEINSGTVADAASIKLPRRIPYHVATEMLFTGRRFTAAEAKHWGSSTRSSRRGPDGPRPRRGGHAGGRPAAGLCRHQGKPRETMHLPVQEAFNLVTRRKLERWTSCTRARTSSKAPRPLPKSVRPTGKDADYVDQAVHSCEARVLA